MARKFTLKMEIHISTSCCWTNDLGMRINCITVGAADSSKRNYIASDQKLVADIVRA